jgi:2-polyprenyl-3-methyl-5-hydroxy-6-metoxy-1,4-benzoquinol methylase
LSFSEEEKLPSNQIDTKKAEQFADRMLDLLNKGAISIMLSIGHRTGLFDVMSSMPPSTSEEIAINASLNERYVREWLGAMVVSDIVDCDPDGPKYSLPREHSAFLTRESAPDNIAVFAQYIPLMGTVEDKIIECFKNGGGVPYSEFPRFHEVMAEDSGQTVVAALLEHILPLVPDAREKLKDGIDVLDVGCGSGRALNLLAKTYPNSRFIGYDLSEEAVNIASDAARVEGLSNVKFEIKDLTSFDLNGEKFDLITAFDAIHDQARPDRVLAGISKALQDDGTFLMQDIAGSSHHHKNIDHPAGPFLYTISTMHCMTVSLAQGGMGLGTMWGEEKAREMLNEAGFKNIEVKKLPHDFQNSFYINKKR